MRKAAIALAVLTLVGPTSAVAQQPRIRTLTEQELVDMMQGSSIQASRSSNTENLIKRLREALAQGRKFTMISLEDLPDTWMVADLVTVGGGGAWDYVNERTKRQNLTLVPNTSARAVEALGQQIGRKIDAVIRFEPAGQTLTTLLAAAELGIPIVDACLAGRAVPELSMQTSFATGLKTGPGAVVTRWGDVVHLKNVVDDYRVEDLARAFAVSSGGSAAMAYNPLTGAQLKKVVIPGDVSTSILYGRTLREARAKQGDPVAALLKVSNGFKLFQGVVTKADMKGDGGFTWWDVEMQGTGPYAGHQYKVFVKNENLVGWLDGKPDAMTPDLIINLDPKTGDTIVGPSLGGYNVNQEVTLIAIPAHALWRTPKGLELLGPRHFGFDFEYQPIEQLQRTRPSFRDEITATSGDGSEKGKMRNLATVFVIVAVVGLPAATTSAPKTRTLTQQELVDMMVGSSILCTRGGDTAGLIKRMEDALAQGREFKIIALEDVPDDWTAFTSFGVGGGGAWEHVTQRMEQHGFVRGKPADPNAPTAIDVLSAHLGKKFDVTFEAEAGGATASALITAARMNIPIVDGCPSGRCLPEVQMSPFFMNGLSRAPLAAVSRYGDAIIIPRVFDDHRVEDLTRALAVASGGGVTVAANAVSGQVLKANLIPGFLSKAIALGRAAREARAGGRDPVAAIVAAGDGYLLFRGIVRRSDTKGERGFGWTDAVLEGTGAFAGSEYRIFNKNENMVAWRDGRLDAAAPDLISPLDPATGWAMRGGAVIGSFVVGQDLAIVGFPNHAIWRTPKAIEMLGPRHFGFKEDYVPLEKLHPRH